MKRAPPDLESRLERKSRILSLFQERVKELAAKMLQDDTGDVAALMKEVVAILPSAWQYPAATSARILLGQQELRTPNFRFTQWRQSSEFSVSDGSCGLIEVAYLKEFPEAAEGPFSAEERKLIDFLAEQFRCFMERKLARQALVDSRDSYHEQLRALAAQLSLTEERERRAIAADLHDHIGQMLATAKIKLGALTEDRGIVEIRQLVDEALRYTRSLTLELSSPVLYELGLVPALESLAERVQEKHGLPVAVDDDGASKPLDETVKVVLFKAARELLMNVVKHARARRATVIVRRTGEWVELVVEDDGTGMPAEKTAAASVRSGGFGLFSIREGLRHCGGEFELRSGSGSGTRARLRAPLKAAGQREP
jgi:signal transduction histidine kinase